MGETSALATVVGQPRRGRISFGQCGKVLGNHTNVAKMAPNLGGAAILSQRGSCLVACIMGGACTTSFFQRGSHDYGMGRAP